MKSIIQRASDHPKYAKIFYWVRLITITSGGQILFQIIGLASGILIIRILPTREYALYTLVNTMLGTITVLSDGGITSGVMAQGGKIWQDREKLGVIVNTGFKLRKRFTVYTLLFAIPALSYLLLHHGATWLMTFWIILSLIPAFFANLSDSLLEIAPKLKQDIIPLQKNGFLAVMGRLLLTAISVFLFPWAFVAIFAGGIPRIWANIQLKKHSSTYVDFTQKHSDDVQKKILSFVKRILPGSVYYCLSGQIIIWLVSILGTTTAIAQIGALGRLNALLSLFTVLFTTLITPRFARMVVDSRFLLQRFVQIHVGLFVFGAGIIFLVWVFSRQLLWILGSGYMNLKTELVLNMAGTVIGLIGGLSYTLHVSRGWAINPIFAISINIATIVIGILIFDVSSFKGILIFNIFLASIQTVIFCAYGYLKIIQ